MDLLDAVSVHGQRCLTFPAREAKNESQKKNAFRNPILIKFSTSWPTTLTVAKGYSVWSDSSSYVLTLDRSLLAFSS